MFLSRENTKIAKKTTTTIIVKGERQCFPARIGNEVKIPLTTAIPHDTVSSSQSNRTTKKEIKGR